MRFGNNLGVPSFHHRQHQCRLETSFISPFTFIFTPARLGNKSECLDVPRLSSSQPWTLPFLSQRRKLLRPIRVAKSEIRGVGKRRKERGKNNPTMLLGHRPKPKIQNQMRTRAPNQGARTRHRTLSVTQCTRYTHVLTRLRSRKTLFPPRSLLFLSLLSSTQGPQVQHRQWVPQSTQSKHPIPIHTSFSKQPKSDNHSTMDTTHWFTSISPCSWHSRRGSHVNHIIIMNPSITTHPGTSQAGLGHQKGTAQKANHYRKENCVFVRLRPKA